MGGAASHGAVEPLMEEVAAVKRNHGQRGKSWRHEILVMDESWAVDEVWLSKRA